MKDSFSLLLLTGTIGLIPSPARAEPQGTGVSPFPKTIVLRQNASSLESFAAQELRRYSYLRTGKVLPVKAGLSRGDRIAVTCKNTAFCGQLGQELGPQQFTLQTVTAGSDRVWWIVGGDEVGTLYGAYRFAEKLGIRFGLDEEILPDEPITGAWPELDETGKPRFSLRGLQPFHDFSTGPDWWNAHDYRNVFSQMAKLRLNFFGLHTYPSWNPSAGPEANVWIGLPEDVDPRGNVRSGYEAGVVTTRRGWAVKAFPTSQYACGAGMFFESDDYGPDFMLECLDWPGTEATATAMFNRYGDLQQDVFRFARRLGIKTCVGTELPLGVPKMLAARLASKGMKPDDPDVVGRLYEGTFLRLRRKVPLDYYWLWIPEVWLAMEPGCPNWEMTSRANIEKDLRLVQAAADAVHPPFGFATSGWRLGTREDPLWLDKRTPVSWAASSINTGLGRDPVEKAYGVMTHRPRWVIAWAEDDDSAGALCCTTWDLQLCVERMFTQASEAYRYGCEGMMAIHWRTAAISPNVMALAQAGWDLATNGAPRDALAGRLPGMEAYWADWGRSCFGGEAGAQAGRALRELDGGHAEINALIQGGAKTTDAQISQLFAPLRVMESLRPRIKGAGNLERFDYWLKLVEATHLRVRTWVLADRLSLKLKEAQAVPDADERRTFARTEILPLRLEVSRNYEEMIAAFVRCAKSPGEIGTLASLESGSRTRIVSAHDSAIAGLLGGPLPAEAAVSTAYRGAPRLFVSARPTQMNANEPLEIRAFILSAAKGDRVALHWRPLGKPAFKKVVATHRARQAYRVSLPAQTQGTVEYYLEAVLDDGRRVFWPATAPAVSQTAVAW